jgi:hypothetical protein
MEVFFFLRGYLFFGFFGYFAAHSWFGLAWSFFFFISGDGWGGWDVLLIPSIAFLFYFLFLSFFRESGTAREIDARFLSDVLRLRSCGIDGSVMI